MHLVLTTHVIGGIATITMDLPRWSTGDGIQERKKLNDAFQEVDKRRDVVITIWQARGPDFYIGEDQNQAARSSELNFNSDLYALGQTLASHSKLLIAVLQGPVSGYASVFLAYCDLIFGHSGVHLTVDPVAFVAEGSGNEVAYSGFVARMGIANANEVCLLGLTKNALELYASGFIDQLFQPNAHPFEQTFHNIIHKHLSQKIGQLHLHNATANITEEMGRQLCGINTMAWWLSRFTDILYIIRASKNKIHSAFHIDLTLSPALEAPINYILDHLYLARTAKVAATELNPRLHHVAQELLCSQRIRRSMDDPSFQQAFVSSLNSSTFTDAPAHHILTGSFRSMSLFLLAFTPVSRRLNLVQTIEGFGPHQYLAKANVKLRDGHETRVYATSWAWPPELSSWAVDRSRMDVNEVKWSVRNVDRTSITAISSYISVPPPYTHIYSAGGPTGEVHAVDEITGGFGSKLQEVLFVEEAGLEKADKTRVALRYGSHGVEFTPLKQAFIPVLGTNTIEMYSHESSSGRLTHIASVPSPRGPTAKDGPRHVKIHPNGKILYSVTEHNNYVDTYRIHATTLEYVSSKTLVPEDIHGPSDHKFRGDTLMLPRSTPSSPIPKYLITTTRGANPTIRGWLSIFALDDEGMFVNAVARVERYETPTSGGKANAIDLLPKSLSSSEDGTGDGVWILLTDEDDSTAAPSGTGAVRVFEWDGWATGSVKVVAEWPEGGSLEQAKGQEASGERIQGASHAIWLD